MEASAETKKTSNSNNKVIIAIILLIVVIIGAAAAIVLSSKSKDDSTRIGYAAEATVMLDQNSLQAAIDEAMRNAREGNIALQYKNHAYSTDGTTFDCYIVNSASNSYDMFLTIFTDPALEDQIFLSELVPPGSGFESITLERALAPGDHQVYVALTQVKDDEETGEQVIHRQVVHTMDFHVTQ